MVAVVAYNVGDAQTCHDHVEQALEIDEDDEDLVLLSARALIELARFDEARKRLARFDDRSPSYALSLSVLALLAVLLRSRLASVPGAVSCSRPFD